MNKKTIMKSLAIAIALIAGTAQVNAQKNDSSMFGVANRIGIGVGAGTEGIGIDLSTPLTKYVQARIGVNIMPDIKINTTATATIAELDRSEKIDINGGIGRTTFDLKFDCYPFPNAVPFFVTAGFSFGGDKLVKITGHSDKLAQLVSEGKKAGVEIGDYNIPVGANGDVNGGIKVSSFRPYLGLGFGRLIPKNRFAVRFELGAQFQGSPKIYADGVGNLDKVIGQDPDDDITKLLDYVKVYPVLKFSLRGRIL